MATLEELETQLKELRQEIREVAQEKDEQIAKLAQQLEDSNNKLKNSLSNVSDLTKAAQTTADTGVNLANTAQATANDGVNRANNAQATANDGVNRANNAQNTANDGVNRANNAQNTANDGVNRANNAQQTIDTALVGKLAPPVAVGSQTGPRITKLGSYTNVNLKVRKGDIVEVIMHGSARGQFYYYIVCQPTQNAKELSSAHGVFMGGGGDPWQTLASNGLFQAVTDGTLEFSVSFVRGDVSGAITIYGLQLVAKVLLNKSS